MRRAALPLPRSRMPLRRGPPNVPSARRVRPCRDPTPHGRSAPPRRRHGRTPAHRRAGHRPAALPHHQDETPAVRRPARGLHSRRPRRRSVGHRTLRHGPEVGRRLHHRIRHGRHPRPCRDHHRPGHHARSDPRSQRRRRGTGPSTARPVRREARPARHGPDRPDLRYPGLLRRRHLRPGPDRLRRRQALGQIDPALLSAAARGPVRDARLPAAAPGPGRRRRPPPRRPRLGHPHGHRLRSARRDRRLGIRGVGRPPHLRPRAAGHGRGGGGGEAGRRRRAAGRRGRAQRAAGLLGTVLGIIGTPWSSSSRRPSPRSPWTPPRPAR